MPFLLSLLASLVLMASALASEPPQVETSAEPPTAPKTVVAARVDGVEVTVEDLIKFAALNPQRVRRLADGPAGRAEVLRLLIGNVLLQQAMAEADILPSTPDPESYQQAYEKLRREHFAVAEEIAEPELRAFYSENLDLFGIPAAVRISQIQFKFPKDADDESKAATKRRAEAALARLDAGEAFAAVAAELTENEGAKASNGDLGFIERERWSPWLLDTLDGVEVGEYTGVVPSPVSYEILKVTESREALVTPFEEVREDVKRHLQMKRERELRDAYIKRLAADAEIVIELEDLQGFFANGVFP